MSKKKISFGVSLNSREMDLVDAICARSGRTRSAVVRFIVSRYFEQMQDFCLLNCSSVDFPDLLDELKKEAI